LHSGKQIELILNPAPENSGIKFIRTDLDPVVEIPALANFVSKTDRSTLLLKENVEIQTTEHLLAALAGSSIHNCTIEINGAELPILDGSSKPYCDAIQKAGVVSQNELQEVFVFQEIMEFKDPETGSEILILPAEQTSFSVMIDFETTVLGTQNATLENIEDFADQIAPARTFSFLHELEQLLDHGLIKGGDLNNAIVYVDQPLANANMDRLLKAFGKDKISVKPNGILDNLKLNYTNEAARHKLLDLIGDLALAGMPIQGKIIATKPGHKINTNLAKEIVQTIKIKKKAGGVLVLNTVPDPENYLTFFMKIDNVKFKKPVYPGDTLIFKLELLTPIRRGICNMRGYAFVNDQLVSEGDLMAQISRRKT
jgi:UDP-3-O-[3-hydroxymyristoyl] N-acetylglucosamine deacetylase/3-hydroxyacyl-[acyl-carrier-protein] dehydratase